MPRAPEIKKVSARFYTASVSGVEVASAYRYYVSEGDSFSGWVVERGRYYSDPLPSVAAMLAVLREVASS